MKVSQLVRCSDAEIFIKLVEKAKHDPNFNFSVAYDIPETLEVGITAHFKDGSRTYFLIGISAVKGKRSKRLDEALYPTCLWPKTTQMPVNPNEASWMTFNSLFPQDTSHFPHHDAEEVIP